MSPILRFALLAIMSISATVSAATTDAPPVQWQYATLYYDFNTINAKDKGGEFHSMSVVIAFCGPDGSEVKAFSSGGGSIEKAAEGAGEAMPDFYRKMGWSETEAKGASILTVLNRLGKDGWEVITFDPKQDHKDVPNRGDSGDTTSSNIHVLMKRPLRQHP